MTFFNFLFALRSNAQRPSAVTGMMKNELLEGMKRRRLGDTDRAVIVVREHKTGLLNNHYKWSSISHPHFFLSQGERSQHYWWLMQPP